MIYEIEMTNLPDGIWMETSDMGEEAEVLVTGFITDAENDRFHNIMRGMQALYLGKFIEKDIPVSQIDRMLVLMKDSKATVYLNDFPIVIRTIAQRTMRIGEKLKKNDILGIQSLSFNDLEVPDDAGIVFFFSVGWRRGLFFDFRPNSGAKLVNINYILGSHYETLQYNELFNINGDLLRNLFQLGWFPFLSLMGARQHLFERLVARIDEGKSVESSEDSLINAFGNNELAEIAERFRRNSLLKGHIRFLETGIERYQHQDYISCISNIWPRLEGILYTFGFSRKVDTLLNNMKKELDSRSLSYPGIFFPKKFRDYLEAFYFHGFDLPTGQVQISRHSHGHGVSDAMDYDRKRALLGILIADQLGYYVELNKHSD